jgi:hypothetical protein
VNVEQFRQALKAKWLGYYHENRSWLIRIGIWVNCEGQRRPSSSFILGTLSTLEPQLIQLLPLIVDLSSNPDRIVIALGLNFNPDTELEILAENENHNSYTSLKMLPDSIPEHDLGNISSLSHQLAIADESCQGVWGKEIRIEEKGDKA